MRGGSSNGIGGAGRGFSRGDRGDWGDQGRVTDSIIGAAIEVHRALGPGLLESAYEHCLCQELALRGVAFERQKAIPVSYKGVRLDCGFRADLVVEGVVLVELKAVEALLPIHAAQTATYLRIANLDIALLMNFNVTSLRQGLRRISALKRSPPSP